MPITQQQIQEEDDAYAKQASDTQNAKQSQEALQGDQQQKPSFISRFMTQTGQVTMGVLDSAISASNSINEWRDRAAHDVGAGIVTGATNIADTAGSAVSSSGKGLAAAEDPAHAADAEEGSLPTSPIWDHAKSAVMDFRDAIAVKDPTLADSLTQGAAQLAVPFVGYSRALSGLHGFANLVAANGLTDATALGPHDPRMADLISLGRQVEGKLGDTLRTLSPDGSAQNAYVNFLADRGDETEAEGRFKNVLDGFGANLVVTPLLHAVASGLKYGTAGLRYAVENGVGSASDMAAPAAQRGSIDWRNPGGEASLGADDKIVARGVPQDMSLTPEQRALERERVAAERDRAEGVNRKFQPEPVPANAAEREGAAAKRDAESPLDSDKALSYARTHAEAQSGAGREASLHDTVSSLAQHMDTTTEEGAFYKGLFDRIGEKNLKTTLVPPGTGLLPSQESVSRTVGGSHNHIEDTVALYKRGFKDNATFVHTVAHESVHAATVNAINSQPAVRTALSGLMNEAIESSAAGKLGKTDSYGFKDPKEFVAEAESNPRFQAALKRSESTDGRSLWDHYKDVIGGIFGLTGAAIAHPLFDQVLTGKKEKTGA